MQPGERVPLGFVARIGVDLQGGADPRAAEDDLSIAGRDVEVLQE